MFGWCRDAFCNFANSCLIAVPKGVLNNYQMVTAVWGRSLGKAKSDVVIAMREKGVEVRPFFHPVSSLPGDRTARLAVRLPENTVGYDVASRAIDLPSGFNLNGRDVPGIPEVLLDALIG